MPRRSITLPDPMRRRLGDRLIEQRAYHLAQATRRHSDAAGLADRFHSEMARLRREALYHARQAADAREIIEAIA